MPAFSYINGFFATPYGPVQEIYVLWNTLPCAKSLVVERLCISLCSPVGRKIEHTPYKFGPQVLSDRELFPQYLVQLRLIVLIMPYSDRVYVAFLIYIILVLRNRPTAAVFGKADRALFLFVMV